MSIREQFESWYLDNWGHTEEHHETLFERSPDDESEYYRLGVRMAHQAWQAGTSVMEAKCAALAAENAESEKRMQQLIQVINNADNDYCMCGEAMETHVHGGCGHPTGMFDYHYNQWLESGKKTPATDSYLAEVRAQGVDAAIEHLTKKFEGTGHIGVPVMALEWLAQELRKGGAA